MDLTTLTAVVDFADVGTAILAVAIAGAAIVVGVKGISWVMYSIKRI